MTVSLTNLGTINSFTLGEGSITLTGSIPINSVIIGFIQDGGSNTGSVGVIDSQHNSYNQVGSFVGLNNDISSNGSLSAWLSVTTTALNNGDTISCLVASGSNYGVCSIDLASGVDPTLTGSGNVNTAFGSSASPSVSFTPNFVNSLLVGIVAARNFSAAVPSLTQASGFATPPNSTTANQAFGTDNITIFGGSKAQPTITSVAYNPASVGGVSTLWADLMVELPALVVVGDTLTNQVLRFM